MTKKMQTARKARRSRRGAMSNARMQASSVTQRDTWTWIFKFFASIALALFPSTQDSPAGISDAPALRQKGPFGCWGRKTETPSRLLFSYAPSKNS